jgi:hypothetical protein
MNSNQKILLLDQTIPSYDRDRICNVQGNFCNILDADEIPIFDAFVDWLYYNNRTKADDWVSRLTHAGSIHWNLDLSGDYNENLGWAPRYPIPGSDWTNNVDGLSKVIEWLLNKNFVVHLHLAADGHNYDPVGWTYGLPWALNNLPPIVTLLKNRFPKCILWNGGWDGCYPDWTPDETIHWLNFLKNLIGDDEYIAMEMSGPGSWGYNHLGNGPDDWTPYRLGIMDTYLMESSGVPLNEDGLQQIVARQLGPAKKNIDPKNDGPWYLNNLVKKIYTCAWELSAAQFTRKQISETDSRSAASRCAYYGLTSFGNGFPLGV